MEFITDRHEHKYKHRAGVPWHRFVPQVKCGKVSLRGYVNTEEEERRRRERERRSISKHLSAVRGPISNCVENTLSSEAFTVMCDSTRSKISDLLSAYEVPHLTKWGDKVMEH